MIPTALTAMLGCASATDTDFTSIETPYKKLNKLVPDVPP